MILYFRNLNNNKLVCCNVEKHHLYSISKHQYYRLKKRLSMTYEQLKDPEQLRIQGCGSTNGFKILQQKINNRVIFIEL